MELSTASSATKSSSFEFKSPLRILVRAFRKSRDKWKQKYMEIKKEIKRFRNQAADARKSREMWKRRGEQFQSRIQELEAQLARANPVQDSTSKKKGR